MKSHTQFTAGREQKRVALRTVSMEAKPLGRRNVVLHPPGSSAEPEKARAQSEVST